MPTQIPRALPIYIGAGFLALVTIGAAIVAGVNGKLTAPAVVAIVSALAALVGVPVAVHFTKPKRLPHVVPGFGLHFGGDNGNHTVDDHRRFLSDFVIEWQARIGDPQELFTTFRELDVAWRSGDSFDEGTLRVRGVTRAPNHIIVANREGRTIGATALAHEIVHAHLWRTRGDPDAAHKDHRFDALVEALRVS